MQTLLAWLPLLICPLMMLFCMLPMLRGKGRKCASKAGTAEQNQAELRQRLADLQQQQLAVREQLLEQEAQQPAPNPAGATPPPATPRPF